RPISNTEWFKTAVLSNVLMLPYALVSPYSTCVVAPLSVAHVMVAVVSVEVDTMLLMTGAASGVVDAVVDETLVVNVISVDDALVLEPLADQTWKWYRV